MTFEEAFAEFKLIRVGHAHIDFTEEDLAHFMWKVAHDQCIMHYYDNRAIWEFNAFDDGSLDELEAQIEKNGNPDQEVKDRMMEDKEKGSTS